MKKCQIQLYKCSKNVHKVLILLVMEMVQCYGTCGFPKQQVNMTVITMSSSQCCAMKAHAVA